jgi:hypothetical protein
MLAGAIALAPRANAQIGVDPPGVDHTHYWSYHMLQPFFMPNPVGASDQFFPNFVPVYLDSLDRLVNWVHKNNSAVQDTFIHYTWWDIENKAALNPATTVILTNQFGQYPANIHNVDFMLVPAWKNYQRPDFPHANHYLCYKADGPPPPPQSYFLQDEWRQDVQVPGPLQFLCVPCWKNHNGAIFPPVDTLTHLAVYPIHPISELFYPFITDQFHSAPSPVQQHPEEYLFVPTLKQLIVTPTRKGSWGELKTHYR